MKIIDRWNEFMGPKDERLAAESNRCAAVGYTILIIGSALCLYYGIMLNQVAETTGHPLLTPLGQSVFPVDTALLIIILASGLISTYLQVRSGTFDTHTRIAQADRIPWDYVALVSLLCGLGLGVTTTAMRILAEVQIVGVENVTWGGDIAIGVVYFTLAFFLAFGLFAATFGVALYSNIDIVGSMCMLMARGAIISVLLVLLVLPALLILCDGIVCRTTRGMTHLIGKQEVVK